MHSNIIRSAYGECKAKVLDSRLATDGTTQLRYVATTDIEPRPEHFIDSVVKVATLSRDAVVVPSFGGFVRDRPKHPFRVPLVDVEL